MVHERKELMFYSMIRARVRTIQPRYFHLLRLIEEQKEQGE